MVFVVGLARMPVVREDNPEGVSVLDSYARIGAARGLWSRRTRSCGRFSRLIDLEAEANGNQPRALGILEGS
jgi:hypothetical protein